MKKNVKNFIRFFISIFKILFKINGVISFLKRNGFSNVGYFNLKDWRNDKFFIVACHVDFLGKVFIKCGKGDWLDKEFEITKYVYENSKTKNTTNAIKLIRYNGFSFAIYKFIDGLPLDDFLNTGQNFDNLKVNGFISFVDNLNYLKIIHRDVRPHNIIVESSGVPIFIDFEHAVHVNEYLKNNMPLSATDIPLRNNGYNNDYVWDDVSSLLKISEIFNLQDDELIDRLEERIGRNIL